MRWGFSMSEVSVKDRGLNIEHYSSFDEVPIRREEWDLFVQENGADIFLTFDCCRLWWKYYGNKRQLHLIIVKYGTSVIAILPLFAESIRVLLKKINVVKLVGADHSIFQFTLPMKMQCCAEVFASVLSYLSDNIIFDVIIIGPLSGVFNTQTLLECDFRQSGFTVVSDKYYDQTFFYPQQDITDYISSLTRKERRNMRKSYRVIESISAEGIEVARVEQSNLESMFKEFADLHQAHWRALGKLGHFGDWVDSREFHQELSKCEFLKGRLRLYRFTVGDALLAYDYGFKFGDVYYDFLNARTNSGLFEGHSLGKIVVCEVLREAAREGVQLVDSMRGCYPYKLKLGGMMRDSKVLHLYRDTLRSRVIYRLTKLYCSIANLLYYKVWVCRVAPRLFPPDKRGPLWRSWVKLNLLR